MSFQLRIGESTPTKNESYDYYFFVADTTATPVPSSAKTSASFISRLISKDDGAFNTTTNAPTEIGNGWYKITLTATEMNADKIILFFRISGGTSDQSIIYTGTSSSGGGSGLSLTTELTDDGVLIGNGTVGDVLKALFYFLKKNRNRKTITR